MSAQLNHTIQGEGQPLVLLHGLFGSLSNLGLLARDFLQDYQVISIDLRNHGLSFHSHTHTYLAMAQDVEAILAHYDIQSAIIVGHSMGGKVAMKLSELAKDRIEKLVVLDIAPVAYETHRHDNVFKALQSIELSPPTSRGAALKQMAEFVDIDGVRQFLAKSLFLDNGVLKWRFNVTNLLNSYAQIVGWDPLTPVNIPTLFIKGGDSEYLQMVHQMAIQTQFTQARAHVIPNTGHWLHAEKPAEVIRVIRKFIAS